MPNPKAIDVPQLGFSDEQKDVLHIMMNKEEWDYSTINEIARMEELSVYSYEDICTAVHGLKNRGFLLEVKKPYGYVYAVNKLRIPNMMFDYS
jgi:hypothetical protein